MKNKLYFFKNVMAIVLLLTLSLSVLAQDRRITGKVINSSDEQGLPGATVQIKGSQTGTSTDANGNFALNLKSGNDILVISSIGFKTKEVKVGTQTTVNVALDDNVNSLDEVIVTGYTSQQKKDITGAVSTIKTKDMIAAPSADFAGQLQGRAAGVQVGQSGEPGAGVAVRIRGIGTFGDNNPLYVIDGVPAQGAFQNAFNANDIESIQILKDASASSIYGSRANNGVIIITTKKGQNGKTIVTYDASYATQRAANRIDLLTSSQDYANLTFDAYKNAGQTPPSSQYGSGSTPVLPDFIYPSGGKAGSAAVDPKLYSADPSNPYLITPASKGTDWQSEMFRSAPMTQHNLGISGGSQTARFALGLNYFDQQGILPPNAFKRYTFRANSDYNIGKFVKIGENLNMSYIKQINQPGGNQNEGNILSNIIKTQPIQPVYDIAGNFSGNKGSGLGNGYNPVAQAVRNQNNEQKYVRLFGNLYLEAQVLKGLTLRTSIGGDYSFGFGYAFRSLDFERSEPSASNGFSEFGNYNQSYTFTNTITYDTKIGADHNISFLAGYEAIEGYGRGINAGRAQYFTEDQNGWTLGGIGTESTQTSSSYVYNNSLASVFGKLNYSFGDKYLASVTVRRDGSSNFGPDTRYAVFPSASIGWRISQESFMKDLTFIQDMKIRASWGQTGNQNIPGGNAYSTYGAGSSFANYALNGSSNSTYGGFAQNRIGNPGTKWEAATQADIGLDLSLLKGKIDVSLDWYTRQTDGFLFQKALPATAGLASPPFVNVGQMENKGVDLSVTYRNNIGKLRYDVTGNFGTYKNTILTIDGSKETSVFQDGSRVSQIINNKPGYAISSFWGYQTAGFFQTQGEVDASKQPGAAIGRWKFKDINGDGKIDGSDQTIIGNPHPDFTYGLNIAATYGSWDATIYVQGVQGNQIWNDTKWFTDFFASFPSNKSSRLLNNSWTPSNPNALLPKNDVSDTYSSTQPLSYYVESGSYLRLKNLELGYTFPAQTISKLGMSRLRVYVQGSNLLTFTKYSGYDPDLTQRNVGDTNGADRTMGVDYGNFPKAETLTLGVNLKF
jgi:TonB-dependent starch-binding outer membrane protein SusC